MKCSTHAAVTSYLKEVRMVATFKSFKLVGQNHACSHLHMTNKAGGVIFPPATPIEPTRTLPQMCTRHKLERTSKAPDSALAQKCQKNHSIMHHTKGTKHSISDSPSKSKPSGVLDV